MHLKAMQWAGVIAVFIGLGCEVLEKAFCKHKKPPAVGSGEYSKAVAEVQPLTQDNDEDEEIELQPARKTGGR